MGLVSVDSSDGILMIVVWSSLPLITKSLGLECKNSMKVLPSPSWVLIGSHSLALLVLARRILCPRRPSLTASLVQWCRLRRALLSVQVDALDDYVQLGTLECRRLHLAVLPLQEVVLVLHALVTLARPDPVSEQSLETGC